VALCTNVMTNSVETLFNRNTPDTAFTWSTVPALWLTHRVHKNSLQRRFSTPTQCWEH